MNLFFYSELNQSAVYRLNLISAFEFVLLTCYPPGPELLLNLHSNFSFGINTLLYEQNLVMNN